MVKNMEKFKSKEEYCLSVPEKFRNLVGVADYIYMVSNWGRVFRVDDGKMVELMLQAGGKYAYLRVDGRSQKVEVGYLVARAFVDNPRMCPYVRFKDGDKCNCTAGNLEWCENKERVCSVKTKEKIMKKVKVKRVLKYTKDGELVATYESVSAASRETDIARNRITDALNGRRETTGGFIWRYEI